MLASRPRFNPAPCSLDIQDSPIYTSLPTPDPAARDGYRDPLPSMYERLRYLTNQLAASPRISISSIDRKAFSKVRSETEHALISLAIAPTDLLDPAKGHPEADYVFEAHRLCALIYLHLVLRGEPTFTPTLQSLKRQVIKILQTAEGPLPCFRPRRKTSIWLCFIAGLVSSSSMDEMWFAERIARSMRKTDVKSWEDVEGVLKEVVWVDLLNTKTCKNLWQRVQDICDRKLEAKLPLFSPEHYPEVRVGDNSPR